MAHDSCAADCVKLFLDNRSPLFTEKLPIGTLWRFPSSALMTIISLRGPQNAWNDSPSVFERGPLATVSILPAFVFIDLMQLSHSGISVQTSSSAELSLNADDWKTTLSYLSKRLSLSCLSLSAVAASCSDLTRTSSRHLPSISSIQLPRLTPAL